MSSGESHQDRRRRTRIQSSTVGWIYEDRKDLTDDAEGWEVRVHDLSRHGVGFETSEELPVGKSMRIRIGRGPVRLARRVKVTNCRSTGERLFAVGAEFFDEFSQMARTDRAA